MRAGISAGISAKEPGSSSPAPTPKSKRLETLSLSLLASFHPHPPPTVARNFGPGLPGHPPGGCSGDTSHSNAATRSAHLQQIFILTSPCHLWRSLVYCCIDQTRHTRIRISQISLPHILVSDQSRPLKKKALKTTATTVILPPGPVVDSEADFLTTWGNAGTGPRSPCDHITAAIAITNAPAPSLTFL